MMPGLLITVGIGTLLLSNGHDVTSWAPFFTNVFLLLFLDSQSAKRGIAILAPLYIVSYFFIWRDVIPAPGIIYFLVAGAYGALYFIPYAIHRAINASKVHWSGTMVFPAAWVAVEILLRVASPYGSWASIAYSQAPDGYLGQLASVGGIGLVSFVIAWISSTAVWLGQQANATGANRRPALAAGIAAIALFTFGEWRLNRTLPVSHVVRIAAITPEKAVQSEFESAFAEFRRSEPNSSDAFLKMTAAADALNSDLFEQGAAAASDGAKIIAWSETAAKILKSNEQTFLAEASALARQAKAYLFVAYGALAPGESKPLQNRLAAITPSGEVAWIYDKSHPIVGSEANFVSVGSTTTPYLETPYGRISVAICHDADFPSLFRDAAHTDTALLIIPSADWREIDWLHANMARYRSVEGGFSIFRPTSNGITFATDAHGRLRSWNNSFETDKTSFLFDLPVQQQRTVYTRIRTLIGTKT